MVGYACYAERFAGTLARSVRARAICASSACPISTSCQLLRPRDGDNDGGYAVADYRMVRPDLGTTEDLRSLTEVLRGQGISLVVDLVLNHVAREHEWARRAAAGSAATATTSTSTPNPAKPDEYEQTLPEVFPDFAPGNFTWDDEVGGWVWTTFNAWRDLGSPTRTCSSSSPTSRPVPRRLGVEVLRLDAVAFVK